MNSSGTVNYGLGNALGPQVWIDTGNLYDTEYKSWNHETYQDHVPGVPDFPQGLIAKDYLYYREELAMVVGLDQYLDQGAVDVRFRVSDIYGNWSRTVNIVDPDYLESISHILYVVTGIGIITQDYQGNQCLSDWCNVPVQDRSSGNKEIDYAAQVVYSSYINPLPSLESTIRSPTTESHQPQAGPDEIQIPIYLVENPSARFSTLNNLFSSPPGNNCNIFYYSRGPQLHDNVIAPSLIVSDTNQSDPQIPIFYLSSNDDLLSPEYSENLSWRDYSIAISRENEALYGIYQPSLDSMYFIKEHERGRMDYCDMSRGYISHYKQDVLKCGLEGLEIMVEGLTARAPIESGGDVYFVIADGCFDYRPPSALPPGEDPAAYRDWQDQNTHFYAIGGFKTVAGGWENITYDEWRNSAHYRDFNWLVSPACGILNNASYMDWKIRLVDATHLNSICGFRWFTQRTNYPGGSPASFFGDFSAQLSYAYGIVTRLDLWWNQLTPSCDPAVIAYMETACKWANNADGSGGDISLRPIILAAAVDSVTRWIIKKEDRGFFYSPHYYIFEG